MKVKLVSVDSWKSRRKIITHRLPTTIGRSAEAAIHLDDCWASRRHCEIDEIDGTLVVRDLGSTHGTFVNGHRITEARLLPGDMLTIGISSFRAQYKRRNQRPESCTPKGIDLFPPGQ
ncbi:MAG TPA: FHA domain-containing protein [Thermoguttaceae bacterium]|nr:FHA domain-containing protein [Thermoguttaceae bacterium]